MTKLDSARPRCKLNRWQLLRILPNDRTFSIGRYEGSTCSGGGLGAVSVATRILSSGATVAIKLLERSTMKKMRTRFRREAKRHSS